jgi:hypothetical protein
MRVALVGSTWDADGTLRCAAPALLEHRYAREFAALLGGLPQEAAGLMNLYYYIGYWPNNKPGGHTWPT